jgi:hypothetical protein
MTTATTTPKLPKRLPPNGAARTAALERLATDIVRRLGTSASLLLASLLEETVSGEK